MNKSQKYASSIKDMSISLLSQGTTIRIRAHGYSMYPSIKPGSLIVIEPIKVKGDPKPGEIVAIKRESGLIVHRIIKISIIDGVRKYIARGDSNARADKPVNRDMIAGRVVRAEPTGENPVPADITIKKNPPHFINRIRVLAIMIRKKLLS
jgi:signal peptidase I